MNPYGRAQGELLMRMRYGSSPDKEPTRFAEPAFGLLPDTGNFFYGASGRFANVQRIPLEGESTSISPGVFGSGTSATAVAPW